MDNTQSERYSQEKLALKKSRRRFTLHYNLSASVDGIVRLWPVVVAAEPAPSWLPELAEAIAGGRLREDGATEPVSDERLQALRLELTTQAGDGFYQRWANWFLAERMRENPPAFELGPSSD